MSTGREPEQPQRTVFIVRVSRDGDGRVTGVVERVRTGEKVRVEALAEVGPALAALLESTPASP